MIRSSSKKMKLNDPAKSGYVQSGNFMTSCLHDQTEYTDDMPIASPDALNNEVPVNIINPENEEEIKENDAINTNDSKLLKQDQSLLNKQSQLNNVNNNSRLTSELTDPPPNNQQLKHDQQQQLQHHSHHYHIQQQQQQQQQNHNQKQQLQPQRTISGGLTLDKTNKSLKNLIYYIKTAYSNNLTSPKWKNFKGLKLQVIEKIRLNNVIWRTWFEQYGTKYPNKKKPRPLLCQFAITLEQEPVVPVKVALLEGEYWKRRLGSITNEYKKWREISRKQIKTTNDGSNQYDQSNQINNSLKINTTNNTTKTTTTPTTATTTPTNNNNNNINNTNNLQSSLINNSLSSNNINNYTNMNYYEQQHQPQTNFNQVSSQNNFDYINNTASFYNDTNYNIANNLNYEQNNFYSNNLTSTGSTTSSNLNQNNSINNGLLMNNSNNIMSKQIPFSNRCRSPSPGLFQDFDLYNFSSDTLFSTYCAEDQKDPIFGTNPDLFQPDLMHLYPNFDFLDLELVSDNYSSNNNNVNNTFESNNIPNISLSRQSFNSPNQRNTAPNRTVVDNNNKTNMYVQNQQQNLTLQSEPINNTLNNTSNSANMTSLNQPQQQQQPPQTSSYITTTTTADSSDLYNFNTLATVAAAQSPNMSPNSEIRQRKNNFKISNGKHIKQQLQTNTNDSLLNSIKITNSLSAQLNDNNILMNNTRMNNNLGQSPSPNGSSNTIRNLLALQSPIVPVTSNINNNLVGTNSNLRLSTGVMSAIGGNLTVKNHQLSSSFASTNTLINSNMSIKHSNASNSSSPPSNISSPTNTSSSTSSSLLDTNNKYQLQDNQQLSALLSVLGAHNSTSSTTNSIIQESISNNNNNNNDLLNRQKSIGNDSLITKNKRGRKPSSSISIDMINNDTNSFDRNLLSINSNNTNSKSFKANNDIKSKKEKQTNKYNSNNNNNNELVNKNSFHLQPYAGDVGLMMNNNSNKNEQTSNSTSPIDSSPNNSNNNNSLMYNYQSKNTLNSINNMNNNYSLITGSLNNIENDFNNSNNNNNNNIMQRTNSNTSLNYMNSLKLPVSLSNDNNNNNSGSRNLSRSNSVNSINTMNDQISTAEQKRRCNIQHGFDRLQTLVPSLKESKNSKASKAAMLQKTSEYIKELQKARQKRMADLDVYKKEIEQLSDHISDLQNQMPVNGVMVAGNLNKTEKFEQKFKTYVKERTIENWKFYLFSILLKPLFENFIKTLNTSSKEDMERTFYEWQEKFCNLVQLRPIISNGLRQLSKSTSILTDSSKLPEECYTAALTQL